MQRRLCITFPLLTTAALGVGVARAETPEVLALRLVELRGEVEDLHRELESTQSAHRSQMASLSQRRAELEVAIRRQELEQKRFARELAANRERNKTATADASELLPLVQGAIGQLGASVKFNVPFKAEERLASLQKLKSDLKSNNISAPRALNRLWSFVEDELRLARENGLYRQTIKVDGRERLADVARLGLVMLFYRTTSGEMGWATRKNPQAPWQYVPAAESKSVQQLEELFAAFEKQVRTGFFTIPNPWRGEQQ